MSSEFNEVMEAEISQPVPAVAIPVEVPARTKWEEPSELAPTDIIGDKHSAATETMEKSAPDPVETPKIENLTPDTTTIKEELVENVEMEVVNLEVSPKMEENEAKIENPFEAFSWKLTCAKRCLTFVLCSNCFSRLFKDRQKVKFLKSGNAKINFTICPDCIQYSLLSADNYLCLIRNKCFSNNIDTRSVEPV
jgi:hypothetical protein